MKKPIRVLIADDHPVLRAGLRALLDAEKDLAVVGEAATASDAVSQSEALRPDVVLLDVQMPGNGLRAVPAILALSDPPKVVILSVCDDVVHVRAALRSGVSGYVTKRAVDECTVEAVRAAHEGRVFIDPMLGSVVVGEIVGYKDKSDENHARLTPRMLEVLRLAAWGYTNQQIAAALSVTVKTVEAHRSSIL
ncbi:MAG TPA: response regulator transcription factor, partial [Armatimonadota bacterium]|nr:response regulator transcription factor [Armatimonadota bacterium]